MHQCANLLLRFPIQQLTLGHQLKSCHCQVHHSAIPRMFNSGQPVVHRTRETFACMKCSKVVTLALLPDIVLNILPSVKSFLMVMVFLTLAVHVQGKGSNAYILPFNLHSRTEQTLSRTMTCHNHWS